MKIRKCPGCAQLVHFEPADPVQTCWNCGEVTDFSDFSTPEERLIRRLGLWVDLSSLNPPSYDRRPHRVLSRAASAGRVAFAIALPLAIIMLLLCNSLDIRLVYDLRSPFMSPF